MLDDDYSWSLIITIEVQINAIWSEAIVAHT